MPMTSWAPRLADMNARPATHAGLARPARKKSVLVFIEPFSATPMPSTKAKYKPKISQSMPVILRGSFQSLGMRYDGGALLAKIGAYEARSVHEMRGPSQAFVLNSEGRDRRFRQRASLAQSFHFLWRSRAIRIRRRHFSRRNRCHLVGNSRFLT